MVTCRGVRGIPQVQRFLNFIVNFSELGLDLRTVVEGIVVGVVVRGVIGNGRQVGSRWAMVRGLIVTIIRIVAVRVWLSNQ